MSTQLRFGLALVALTAGTELFGQGTSNGQNPQPRPTDMAPPPANVVAATVNGQSIAELAVFRGVPREERNDYEVKRKVVLEHLIENSLIEQYLIFQKIEVPDKELDDNMAKIRADAEMNGGFQKVLAAIFTTEAEVRRELAAMLRWERFVTKQSGEATLRDFFSKNKEIFDGSQVHARHILLKLDERMTKEQASARLVQLKRWIEEETQRELAKLPPEARTAKRYAELLEKTFSEVAAKESACPSRENGGDLRWFQRDGMMVEPFARTAFALNNYQMSDVLHTRFGCHLILTVDRKPGKDVKFDDNQIKILVREVYGDRLREAVLAAMRPNANIVISPRK